MLQVKEDMEEIALSGQYPVVVMLRSYELLEKLGKDFTFSEQQRIDENHRAVRFCTSWATTAESVDALCAKIKKLSV